MKILCLLCDHQTDEDGVEIVNHITEHHGGLEAYLHVFPFAPIVCGGIEEAIMKHQPLSPDIRLSDTDISIIAMQQQQLAPLRSEIITVEA